MDSSNSNNNSPAAASLSSPSEASSYRTHSSQQRFTSQGGASNNSKIDTNSANRYTSATKATKQSDAMVSGEKWETIGNNTAKIIHEKGFSKPLNRRVFDTRSKKSNSYTGRNNHSNHRNNNNNSFNETNNKAPKTIETEFVTLEKDFPSLKLGSSRNTKVTSNQTEKPNSPTNSLEPLSYKLAATKLLNATQSSPKQNSPETKDKESSRKTSTKSNKTLLEMTTNNEINNSGTTPTEVSTSPHSQTIEYHNNAAYNENKHQFPSPIFNNNPNNIMNNTGGSLYPYFYHFNTIPETHFNLPQSNHMRYNSSHHHQSYSAGHSEHEENNHHRKYSNRYGHHNERPHRQNFRNNFGSSDGYDKHSTNQKKNYGFMEQNLRLLNQKAEEICSSLEPAPEEKINREKLLKLLQKITAEVFPDAELHPFGSTANGFGLANADMDLCVCFKHHQTQITADICVERLGAVIKKDVENFTEVKPLVRTRIPIIKLKHTSGVSCDIGFENKLALYNTKLLSTYSKIDSRVKKMVYLIKNWSKARCINEPYLGTLSSYCYVLMIIYFLQQRSSPVLPCLQKLTSKDNQGNNKSTEKIVDGYNVYFLDNIETIKKIFKTENKETIFELLFGFFQYYAYDFNWNTSVVSIRTGKILTKEEKGWVKSKLTTFSTGVNVADRFWLCVEDPFEIEHNLGRPADKDSIYEIRGEFIRATKILKGKTVDTILDQLYTKYIEPPIQHLMYPGGAPISYYQNPYHIPPSNTAPVAVPSNGVIPIGPSRMNRRLSANSATYYVYYPHEAMNNAGANMPNNNVSNNSRSSDQENYDEMYYQYAQLYN